MNDFFQKIGFIGYGKFTRLLIELFSSHVPQSKLKVLSRSHQPDGETFFSKEEVYSADLIIPCVPIRNFAESLDALLPYLKKGQTILDVCSVKVFPKKTMLEKIPADINIICSHPMFGPASYEKLGHSLKGCCAILENVRSEIQPYQLIKDFFASLDLNVIEMTAEEHDAKAAQFQFITLTTATVLKKLNIKREIIDTPSALKMLDFLDMISVDGDLVLDLYKYNPYCHKEFSRLKDAFETIQKELDECSNN